MKYVMFAMLSFAMVLCFCQPANAVFGLLHRNVSVQKQVIVNKNVVAPVRQQVVVQKVVQQQVVQQQVYAQPVVQQVQVQRIYAQPVVQQVIAQPVQQVYVPAQQQVIQQQVQGQCYNGGLQLNSLQLNNGGCQQLYR